MCPAQKFKTSGNRIVCLLYMGIPGEEIIHLNPKYPLTFDHFEFVFLGAYIDIRFVKVLPFLLDRDDHNRRFFSIDDNPIFNTPIGDFL